MVTYTRVESQPGTICTHLHCVSSLALSYENIFKVKIDKSKEKLCVLVVFLQLSATQRQGYKTFLLKDILSLGVVMSVMDSSNYKFCALLCFFCAHLFR